MVAQSPPARLSGRLSSRLALGALALAAVGVAGGGATLYLRREAIGVRLALDYLRAHGVPAVLRLDRLDLGGASGAVRLGPAAHPDLTVGRVEARFGALPAPWRGVRAPPLRALSLEQPVLHARWRDGRLDFGSLQPLIDQALAAKPSGAPPPDLFIHDGRLRLDTPGGGLRLVVDAVVRDGRVRSLHVRLEPCDLTVAGARLSQVQGVVSGQATGLGGLHLSGAFGAAGSRAARGAAAGLTLGIEALAPNGAAGAADDGAGRPLDAVLRLHAGRFALEPLHSAAIRVRQGELALDLDGRVDGRGAFHGALRIQGRAAELSRAGLTLKAASLTLRSLQAQAAGARGGVTASGPFGLQASSEGGRLAAGGLDSALAPARVTALGRLDLAQGLRLRAEGAVRGGAGLSPSAAQRLAQRALRSFDPQGVAPLAQALGRVQLSVPDYLLAYDSRRGATLGLPHGVLVAATDGGLTMRSTGALRLRPSGAMGVEGVEAALTVRGLPQATLARARLARAADGALTVAGALSARGDVGPVQGGALDLDGEVRGRPGAWRVGAAGCARLSAHALRLGRTPVRDVSAQVCPDGAEALASLDGAAWAVRGQVRGVQAALPSAQLKLALAAADVTLAGGRGPPSGGVALAGLALQDTSPEPRFRPLTAKGGLRLSRGGVEGRLPLALAGRATPLGVLTLAARLDGTRGTADLDTGALSFAPDGLQPGDIAPPAARLLPQAKGELQLLAHAAWSPAGLSSSGELRSDGFSYRSPAGKIDDVRGDVRLASLAPLASAPHQSLTAARLETLVPLEAISAGFTLAPQGLSLDGVTARAAGGAVSLDPMRLPLGGGATTGVLRLKGVDLQALIAALNLSDAVSLQARVDGALPFALTPALTPALAPAVGARPATLRLAAGRVYAEGPGRLTIRRQALTGAVATAGAAGVQPNAVQDFAYQALEDLAFTTLEADVASRPQGRLGVIFHVVGRHEPKLGRPTRISLFALLRGHAFDKPLPLPKGTPVDLTLDSSLNLDDILAAYGVLGGAAGSAKVQP